MEQENLNYYEQIRPKMMKKFELMYRGTKTLLLEYFNEYVEDPKQIKSALDLEVLASFKDGDI